LNGISCNIFFCLEGKVEARRQLVAELLEQYVDNSDFVCALLATDMSESWMQTKDSAVA
jgi:hypothetical protein